MILRIPVISSFPPKSRKVICGELEHQVSEMCVVRTRRLVENMGRYMRQLFPNIHGPAGRRKVMQRPAPYPPLIIYLVLGST
jgi:hypothetical protein